MKRLRRFYRNETAYSITLKRWPSRIYQYLLKKKGKDIEPGIANIIVNLAVTLEKQYSIDPVEAIVIAIEIYNRDNKTIKQFMDNWFDFGRSHQRLKILPPKKALKEQIARGFISKDRFEIDYSSPYIVSTVGKDLIYPHQWPNMEGLQGLYQKRIGVPGYTRIVLPKNIASR